MNHGYSMILVLILMMAVAGCKRASNKQDIKTLFVQHEKNLVSEVHYAEGFDVYRLTGATRIVVYHSGDKARGSDDFFIVDKDIAGQYRDSSNVFTGPPHDAAVFSATQLNAFEKLGILDKVVGISEAAYINNPFIREQVEKGNIAELAGNGNFFAEKTLIVNPSVIFYTPYSIDNLHALDITKIPRVSFNDYLETNPLGRAEWIKFTAAFFNKSDEADRLFDVIVEEYNKYKRMAENVTDRPTVFTGKYFNGQWFVAGGKSYAAGLFADAGADYIWKNDRHTASFPLEYEVVYQKAHDADYWRIMGSYGEKASYIALEEENELYKHFKAFTEHSVIYCNVQKTAYFENSPLEPQIVLADLIKAFHPDLLPGYHPKYFRLMK